MPLPTNLSYTYITGRFIRAVLDTEDDQDKLPDSIPVAGLSVTISPNLPQAQVKNVSSSPPVTILIDVFTCTTDSNGDLISPDGARGVYVISSDDDSLNPSGWTYNVRISSTFFEDISVDFIAPSGGEIDLTTLVPVPASGGSYIEEWATTVTAAQAALKEVQDIRDVLTGQSANVPYLDEYSKIKEENVPVRLGDTNLRELVREVGNTTEFNVAIIDGGGAGSYVSLDIDGGTPDVEEFDETIDAGLPDSDFTGASTIDGGQSYGE